MGKNDNKIKYDSPSDKKPVAVGPEVRITGAIILGCIAAIIIAVTIRVFRWITGF